MTSKDPGLIAVHILKVPLHERYECMNKACGSDDELRKKVEELIRAYEDSAELSDDARTSTRGPAKVRSKPAVRGPRARIGNYKLLQQIGEGGFGIVYMAEQSEPVRRQVALKVIKPGMDTREVIARFEVERQALAMMEHPNIARVFDAGTTESGLPYFVMELVRGVSITEYCSKNGMATRELLELFADVCHAVQHAHHKGIIHRDLKPSNILVTLHDGKPVAKVIDFGVAKALNQQLTQRTLFTAYGQMVGTPQYMSPEQAEMSGLGVDTRSDIYSLGVLLYELLTGTTPFDSQRLRSAAIAEMVRIIREEEPPKPSTRVSTSSGDATVLAKHRGVDSRKLAQELRGELDWIVMKAIEKDRNRRYATANGLVADLNRYLNDEAVLACPPSARYRFQKFARRNRALLATAAGIGAILLVCATLSTITAFRALNAHKVATNRLQAETAARAEAERARKDESSQRKDAERQRDRARKTERAAKAALSRAVSAEQLAQTNFQKARASVDQYLTTVSENQLLTVPGVQPLRQELLDLARNFYEHFVADRSDDFELRAGLASTYLRLGNLELDLRNREKASSYHIKAQEGFEALVRDGDRSPATLRQLAEVFLKRQNASRTVTLCNAVLREHPDDQEAQLLLANAYNTIGVNSQSNASAIEVNRKAFEIRRRLVEQDPTNSSYLGDLSSTINNMGVLLAETGERVQGLDMYRHAVRYVDSAFALAPYSMQYGRFAATTRQNIAISAGGLGFKDEAVRYYQTVAETWNTLAINNPGITAYKTERYRALQQLANYQQRIELNEEAAKTFRRARQSIENLPQEDADDLYNVAKVYGVLSRSRGPDQETMSRRAVQALARVVELEFRQPDLLEKERSFSAILEREQFKRLLEVLELEQQIRATEHNLKGRGQVARIRASLGRFHEDPLVQVVVSRTLHSIGDFYLDVDDFEAAEETSRQIISLLKDVQPQSMAAVELAKSWYQLGDAHFRARRFQEAMDAWEKGRARFGSFESLQEPLRTVVDTASAVEELAVAENIARLGALDLALDHYRQSFESIERGQKWFTDTHVHLRYAWLLAASGDTEGFQEQTKLMEEKFGQDPTGLGLAHLIAAKGAVGGSSNEWQELLRRAQESVNTDKSAWRKFALGLAYLRNHNSGAAVDALEMLLDAHGTHNWIPWGYYLAIAYHQNQDPSNAMRVLQETEVHYQRRLKDALAFCDVAYNLHDWRGEAAHLRLARSEAWKVVKGQEPHNPWSQLIEARALAKLGRSTEADEHFATALTARHPEVDVVLKRAQIYGSVGRYNDALADFARAVEMEPRNPQLWIAKGNYLEERGEQPEADAAYAHAAQLTGGRLNPFLEGGWWVVGPFPSRLDEYYQPLSNPDPTRPVHTVDPKTGRLEGPVSWALTPTGPRGSVPSAADMPDNSSWYAFAYIYANQERTARIDIFSETKLRLWVNGELVGDLKAGYVNWPQHIAITLRAGRNLMMVKAEYTTKRPVVQIEFEDSDKGRAYRYAKHGLWDEAAELVAGPAYEDLKIEPIEWSYFAPLLLIGKTEENFATQFGELYERDRGEFARFRIAMLCALSPDAVFEQHAAESLVHLQQFLVNRSPKSAIYDEALLAHALFRYRLGELDEASSALTRVYTSWGTNSSHAVAAMIAHARGTPQVAEELLAKAIVYAHRENLDLVNSSRAAEFALMLRKAETDIRGTTLASDEILQHWRNAGSKPLETRDPQLSAYEEVIYYGGTAASRMIPNPFVARGKRLAELGRFDEAAADFDKAVELAAQDYQPLLERAKFRLSFGRVSDATDDLVAALDLANRDGGWSAHGRRVEAEIRCNLAVLDELQMRGAKSAWWRLRGCRAATRYDWNEAARCFAASQKWWSHCVSLAAIRCIQEDFAGHESACLPLPQLVKTQLQNPLDGAYWQSLAVALFPQQASEEGEMFQLAKTAYDSAPENARNQFVLGLAYYRTGQYDKALELLHESAATAVAPSAHNTCRWAVLAMTCSQQGQTAEARRWLKRCDTWAELTQGQIELATQGGDEPGKGFGDSEWIIAHTLTREAQATIEGPLSLVTGDEHRAAWAAGLREEELRLQRRRRQRAEANWQQIVDRAGDDATLFIHRGQWYESIDEHEKAAAHFLQAVSLAPEDATSWIARARFYQRRGERVKAAADFKKARQVDPDHPLWKLERLQDGKSLISAWDFSQGLEGWQALKHCRLSSTGNSLLMSSTDKDPHFGRNVNAPAGWKQMTICARILGDMDSFAEWNSAVYWATVDSPNFDKEKSMSFQVAGRAGRWLVYQVFFLPDAPLTKVRIDPANESGVEMEIAWIALASRSLEEAFAMEPDSWELWTAQAEMHSKAGDQQLAIEAYQKVVELNPDHAPAWRKRAVAFAKLSKWTEACEDLDQVLRLLPRDTKALNDKSMYSIYARQYASAIDSCNKALEIDPSLTNLYHRRARGYIGVGDYQKAIADCNFGIEMAERSAQPTAWHAYYSYRNRSLARRLTGDIQGAIADAQKAIALNPNKTHAYEQLGPAFIAENDWQRALETYQRLVEKSPKRALSWLLLLDLAKYMESRQLGPAGPLQAIVKQVQSSTGSLEGNLEVVFQLAAWQLLSGEQEVYEETCRQSIAEYAGSDNARELYLVARMCSLSSRSSIEPQKLVAIASRAAELEPNTWHVHTLGLSLLRAGKYEQAIREFESSLAEPWLDATNWLGLAIANRAAGRPGEAREFLQMARQSTQQQLIDLGSRSTISSHDRIACQLLLREAEKLIGN